MKVHSFKLNKFRRVLRHLTHGMACLGFAGFMRVSTIVDAMCFVRPVIAGATNLVKLVLDFEWVEHEEEPDVEWGPKADVQTDAELVKPHPQKVYPRVLNDLGVLDIWRD